MKLFADCSKCTILVLHFTSVILKVYEPEKQKEVHPCKTTKGHANSSQVSVLKYNIKFKLLINFILFNYP